MAFITLHLYRIKDITESAFSNIKDWFNMRHLLAKSEMNLDGIIFTEFVSYVLIACLDHKMKEAKLYKKHSMQQLLDKFDVFECFEDEKHKLHISEVLNKQSEIYDALGAALPTSSYQTENSG